MCLLARSANAPHSRARRCVVGGIFILALVVLIVVRVAPMVRGLRRLARPSEDRAAALLALSVRGLPHRSEEWGEAMAAELAAVTGTRARWRFSLGCTRVALTLRLRQSLSSRDRGGRALRGAVLAATAGCLGLAIYGLVRYPGLRDGPGQWLAVAVFLALLAAYALGGVALCRGVSPHAARARAQAALGGVAVGIAWLLILAPDVIGKQLVFVPLLTALVVPAAVAYWTTRTTGDARLATGAGLWSGLIAALLVFTVWATTTFARNGRPYDAQLVRDFHASGSHDLATYAVADSLGAAVGLLFIIPLVALALGSLVAQLAARADAVRGN